MKKNKNRLYLLFITILLMFTFTGCVYYNTFFIAKKHYNRAERDRQKSETEAVPQQAIDDYKKVIEKSSKVLAFYPESDYVDDALFLLGMSFLWTDEPVNAATKFEELLAGFPDSEYEDDARYWRSVAWMKAGDFEKAEAEFMALLENEDYATQAAFMIAQSFFEKKDYVSAEIHFEDFLANNPESELRSLAAYRLMYIAWEFKDYEGVIEYSKIIERKKITPESWFKAQMMIGSAYLEMNMLDEALAHFNMMKRVPGFSDRIGDISVKIGQIFFAQNDTLAAIETWEFVIENYGRTEASAWSYYYMGELYLSTGNLELALEKYTNSTKEYRSGYVYELAQEKVTALKNILGIKELLVSDDKNIDVVEKRLELAEMYVLKLGMPDSAIAQYKKILEEYPDNPLAAKAGYSLGWTYAYSKEEWKTADSVFASLLNDYPKSDYALGAVEYFQSRGAALDSTEVKSVGFYFVKAEEYIFTYRNPSMALKFYDVVIDSFPESILVPKALTAKAYIYTELMNNPQKAEEIYKIISEEYPKTPYDSLSLVRLGEKDVRLGRKKEMTVQDSIIAAYQEQERQKEEQLAERSRRQEPEIPSDLAGLERFVYRTEKPLEYQYPLQEWSSEVDGRKVRFKIFVDPFGGIKEAELYPGGTSGNSVIDEAIRLSLLEATFETDRIDISKLNQYYLYEVRVDKPWSERKIR